VAPKRTTVRSNIGYRVLSAIVSGLIRPFVRIELARMELARTENGIVICNHRSMMDVAVGLVAFRRLGRYPRLAVAGEYFTRTPFRWALRVAGAIAVDRENPKGTVRRVAEVVNSGTPVVILAEGKLHVDPADPTTTGSFKTGAARIAYDSNLPIWPIALAGTDQVWPPHRPLPHVLPRRTVRLLGSSRLFWMDGDAAADTARLRAEVEALLIDLAKV
jgi:1-acyl-sn-glycerol-3-phosphate acyltransferase